MEILCEQIHRITKEFCFSTFYEAVDEKFISSGLRLVLAEPSPVLQYRQRYDIQFPTAFRKTNA
jgi:hypothetical protein